MTPRNTWWMVPCLCLAAAWSGLGWLPVAQAGGTPENAILVVDPTDADSLHVANYYIQQRGILPTSVLYIVPNQATYERFNDINLPALFGSLANARSESYTDYVIVAPTPLFFSDIPAGKIVDTCFAVQRISLSAGYTLAFVADEVEAGGLSVTWANRYYQGTNDPNLVRGFDSNTLYLSGGPSTSTNARRYFIGAMLGYTLPFGNSVDELLDMIDRSVDADGSFPTGTFYFMNNTSDPPRNVRAPQYSGVINTMTTQQGAAAQQIVGPLPNGKTDCLGVLTGDDFLDVAGSGVALLPGSFADHLTSWAAQFDISAQTKLSTWITNGASGSWGAVWEPCNYTGKFPHSRMHLMYFEGLSLGEAALRSAQYAPFQMLLYGDPLTRPWAYIPTVGVNGLPSGAAFGTLTLTPTATTTNPSATVNTVELLIDGRPFGSRPLGQSFTVDTTVLADGWHDLRVIALEGSLVRSAGSYVGQLIVNNKGRTASINVSTQLGNLATPFNFSIAATGAGVVETRVLQNGRVVARVPGAGGSATVYGRTLGAGPARVQAEALYSDGSLVKSPPITLSIAPAAGNPSGGQPIAYSYTKRVLDHAPFVVELPATLDQAIPAADYAVLSLPTKSTTPPNQSGASRVFIPGPNAKGTDTLTFRAIGPTGASNVATVTIVYDNCPDLTGDWAVNDADLGLLLNSFGACDGDAAFQAAIDLDLSGCVDDSDLGLVLNAFGQACP